MQYYELTNETLEHNGVVLHRIRATRDFENQGQVIKAGTLGGWVENDENIRGNSWVADEAKVYGCATVTNQVLVSGDAEVYDNAFVTESARVTNKAKVYGSAWVEGFSFICGGAKVFDNAFVSGYTEVGGYAQVYGNTSIHGLSAISGNARVYGKSRVYNGTVNAQADIADRKHFLHSQVFTSKILDVSLFRTSDLLFGHYMNIGCWSGTIDELEELVKKDRWVETEGADVLESREEMMELIGLCRARMKRWQ